ncbi:MAG: AAA domain-containing protein, partial [Colwellia sp.]
MNTTDQLKEAFTNLHQASMAKFIEHIDDWIEYLSLLLDSYDEADYASKTKYSRQLKWVIAFRSGANATLEHNNMLAALYSGLDLKLKHQPSELLKFYPILDCYQNDSSQYAFLQIQKALSSEYLFLLQGPPGTGKTTAIVEMVLQTLKENPRARILITSETHVAVDNALDRISRELDPHELKMMMRYPKFSKDTEFENPSVRSVEAKAINAANWLGAFDYDTDFTAKLYSRLNLIEKKEGLPKWAARNIADKHNIIGTTCNQIEHLIDENSSVFDLVIVDECSKATLPEWIMALSIAKKCVLVGDHKQLPPTFCKEESDVLTELDSYQKALIKDGVIDRIFEAAPECIKGTLLTQYRMQPNIGSFISEFFYESKLIHHSKQTVDSDTNFGWLDYSTRLNFPKKNVDRSSVVLSNTVEVSIIKRKIIDLIGQLNNGGSKNTS